MKNTAENRQFVTDFFAKTDFKFDMNVDTNPFMLFGIGWGKHFLKCICIWFETDKTIPHIVIEYSPWNSQSSYFYMELNEENILKLPKTEKEFMDDFYPKMSKKLKHFSKQTA